WARYHRAANENARSRATAKDALGLATTPDQPLVRLASHRLLGEIETISNNHTQARAHLMTALDLTTACDAPFERALTLLALAKLNLATGLIGAASPLLDEARATCVPLGAMPTLASVDDLVASLTPVSTMQRYPDRLTPREVEILSLLPRGLSTP